MGAGRKAARSIDEYLRGAPGRAPSVDSVAALPSNTG